MLYEITYLLIFAWSYIFLVAFMLRALRKVKNQKTLGTLYVIYFVIVPLPLSILLIPENNQNENG